MSSAPSVDLQERVDMYVRACARRSGPGCALLRKVIEHAALSVEEVILTVGANNDAALMLYEAAGFQRYGVERRRSANVTTTRR